MFFEMILSAMAQYSPYIDDDEDVMLSERIPFSSRAFQEEEEEEEEEERPSSSNGISERDKSDEAKTADGDNDGEKNALGTTASSTNTQAVPRKIVRPPQPRPKRAILNLQTYLPDAKRQTFDS
jgi:hypothetical protein